MAKCINTIDCEGNTCDSVPTEVLARRVVQHADDVPLRVCIASSNVPDFEHVVKCEVDGSGVPTGTQVLVIVSYANDGTPTMTYYDLVTGLVWAGDPADLRNCNDGTDTDLEMVAMCDDGTDFIRWIVTENGEPNGVSYDTDLTGASYVVTGTPVIGTCSEVVAYVSTPDGVTITGNTPTSAPTSTVKSLTVTALIEDVTITTGSGSILITQGGSFTWGQGTQNDLDASVFTFTGSSATAQYALTWEE